MSRHHVGHCPLHSVAAEIIGKLDHGGCVVGVLAGEHVIELRPGSIGLSRIQVA
jgi:hypothetical protein